MLNELTDKLWTATFPLSLFGAATSTRTTIVRLEGGDLWLHSPGPIDDALAAEIDAEGAVTHLIAPCAFHHLYLTAAMERWPDAQVWAAPAAAKKQKLPPDAYIPLTDAASAPWANELVPHRLVGAPMLDEVDFWHAASRTMIMTDALFNLSDLGTGWSRLLFRVMGLRPGPCQSRLLRFAFRDRDAVREYFDEVIALRPARLIMAHGEIEEDDPAATLREATAWLRG